MKGFNPCFVGEGIQTFPFFPYQPSFHTVSILVLLEKGFRQKVRIMMKKLEWSFNPCFVGEGIQTLIQFKRSIVCIPMFQSLFCWRRDSDRNRKEMQR